MAASGRVERAERTIFQLLLQEITVVLEVPKKDLRFAWLFLTNILISGIIHVYVRLQIRFYKAYHEPFFTVRITNFYWPIFNQSSIPMLLENL